METISLDSLRDREHALLDNPHDDTAGLHYATRVDRFMEVNHGRMGEDSEELTMRENRTSKLLQERPIPSYQPYGEGLQHVLF